MIKQSSKTEIDERTSAQLRMTKRALDLLRENTQLREKLRVLELQLKVANDALQIANARSHRGRHIINTKGRQYERGTLF